MNTKNNFQTQGNTISGQLKSLLDAWEVGLKDGKKNVVWFEYGQWRGTARYSQWDLTRIDFINSEFPDWRQEEVRVFIEWEKATEFTFTKKGFKYCRDNGIARWDPRRSIWILPEIRMKFDPDGKKAYLWTELRRGIEAHIELYLRGESFSWGSMQWAINSFGFFSFDISERIQKVDGDIPDLTQNRVNMEYAPQSAVWISEETTSDSFDVVVKEKNPQVNYYITISEQTITVYIDGDFVDSFYLTPTLPEDISTLFGLQNTSQLIELTEAKVANLSMNQ